MTQERKKYIIGNWKMNFTIGEASLFAHKLKENVVGHTTVEIVLAPSMLALQTLSLQLPRRTFKLASQNLYWRDEGAYTGEVSAHQLRGLVQYAIIGHSERRNIFHESPKEIGLKVQAAVRNNIRPIVCIGETALERADGETQAILHDQIVGALHGLTSEDVAKVIVAYEPVWAISNGRDFQAHATATPEDISTAEACIRRQLTHLYGKTAATAVPVLYGGSVSPTNAAAYLKVKGIDGLLIGGASLKSDQFSTIIETAHAVARKQ